MVALALEGRNDGGGGKPGRQFLANSGNQRTTRIGLSTDSGVGPTTPNRYYEGQSRLLKSSRNQGLMAG